ncbi:uncharacterized protein LOC9661493 isoform X1 [Selaginella moellendorffii]|uniref:uncharacterized protein LOC9661493 isoform X1 n=1 Tax=Selaginella moellendorffii TaxID=88036 RepID=UPI000D1C33F1|nr:uncharacterized protein LOC9661493 isoform X1 [Selaginella moellendorffii]|eukprot:XP_024543491.1 uncharacterized protein LOC9661493 isoform X1 [Selaginella moellendorffii]
MPQVTAIPRPSASNSIFILAKAKLVLWLAAMGVQGPTGRIKTRTSKQSQGFAMDATGRNPFFSAMVILEKGGYPMMQWNLGRSESSFAAIKFKTESSWQSSSRRS